MKFANPIRLKVFIPALLLVVLVSLFILYRLDAWVTQKLEDAISMITDTRTDITGLKISFVNSALTIRRLEVASSADEFKNAAELEDVVIDFQSLPLLRKRLVVDNFGIAGIQWGTRRTTSGKLPPRVKDNKPSWFSDLTDQAVQSVKKDLEEAPVSKLLDFRIPDNPREVVDALQLQSPEIFKGVVSHTQQLQANWEARIKEISDTRPYESRIKDIRGLTQNVPQNPQEIIARIQTVQQSVEFFESEKKKADLILNDAKTDFAKVQGDYDTALKAFDTDLKRAQEAVSLDQLNMNNFTRLLFGREWMERADKVLRYHKLLRQLLAKSSASDGVQVMKRAKGRDIIFLVDKKQPSFVLAKSEFAVKGIENGDRKAIAQEFRLKLADINSSPKLYGKPSKMEFVGTFRDAVISQTNFNALWDYTKDVPYDDYKASVTRLNAESWPLGIPRFFPVKIGEGAADVNSELEFKGEDMKWVSTIAFKGVKWDFKEVPKQGFVVPLLQDIFEKVGQFQVTLEMIRKAGVLAFNVKSDLDDAVTKGLNAAIEKRFNEFKERLHQELEVRVTKVKSDALKQVSSFQTQVQDRAAAVTHQLQGFTDEANKSKSDLENKAKHGAQSKVEEQLKDVKKSLPKLSFPKF